MAVNVGCCQLRRLLNQRNMTQNDLADLTGLSKTKISDYVNNRSVMSLGTAAWIAECLKCSIDDLYEYKRR